MAVPRAAPALLLLVPVLAAACSAIPRDGAGSTRRIRNGELRAGAVHHPPWVIVEDGRVSGIEAELIEAWARELGARVRWQPGSESELVERLRRRDLDAVAAGFDSRTPYAPDVALSQPYVAAEDRYGATRERRLAVMPGENALLLSLDRFLASQDRAALRRRAAPAPAFPEPRQP